MFVKLKGSDALFSYIPKCGSSTLGDVKNTIMSLDECLDYSKRIMFIRDPIDRIKSCYSFFCMLKQRKIGFDGADFIPLGSYESFIDYALANKNYHWNSQVEQMTLNGLFLPTEVRPLSELSETIYNLTGAIPCTNNIVYRLKCSDYKEDELNVLYVDDLAWL